MYTVAITMAMTNNDPTGLFIDKVRLGFVTLGIICFLMSAMQICLTWISIGGSAGKKNVKVADYPVDLRHMHNGVHATKYTTLAFMLFCVVSIKRRENATHMCEQRGHIHT